MEMQPSEIVDRYTIVKLKVERTKNKIFNKEYAVLKQEVDELKKKHLLKESWINELYRVNSESWRLHSMLVDLGPKKEYEKIGRLLLKINIITVRRANIKIKITTSIKKGYVDKYTCAGTGYGYLKYCLSKKT